MKSRTVAPFAIASLLAASLAAQETPPAQDAPQASFGTSVEVRVVNVDVEVTDRDGVPVNGLEKGDFELRVDGTPVEITNFDRATRPTPPSAPLPEPLPSEPGVAPLPESAPPVARPKLMVFIDDLHMLPAHRNRVLKELATQLEDQETLGVDVGIVRFDRSFQLVRAPGDRQRPISAALEELARKSGTGAFTVSARRLMIEEIDDLLHQRQGCGLRSEMEAAAERYAQPLRNDVLASFNALQDFVASVAGLPGRKVVLYVADALPLEPGQEAYLYIQQVCPQDGGLRPTSNVSLDLREVGRAANAAGVTLYTYQAGGLPAPGDAAGFSRGLDAGNAMVARGNDQDGFQAMAADTGGKALLDSNRIAPLVEQIREDISTAYSLGFSPAGPPDGKPHTIEVRVKRDGVVVRHRETFTDRPNADRRTDKLLAALRFGGGDNPLGVRVEVAPTRPAGKELIELPLRVLIPAASLVFTPGGDGGEMAQIEISLAVSDDRGRSAPVQKRALSVARAKLAEDLSKAVLRVPFDLKLRKGPTNLAIAVRDVTGETESILRHALDLR